jgi:hypothetical protein
MTYTYADVRAIDTRLDEVFGTMGWSFTWDLVDAATAVVSGRLIVTFEGVTKTIEECGYPNAAGRDEEPIKSSVTDSRRRAAAALGIGRSLYSAEKVSGSVQVLPRVQAPLSVAPRPLSVDSVKVSQPSVSTSDPVIAAALLFAEGECPEHRTAWQFKPAGVSKMGKEYNAFYACGGKTDGQFCKRKPSIAWVNAQSAPLGEPERNESDLESLPF